MTIWEYICHFFAQLRLDFLGATASWPSWAQVLLDGVIGIIIILAISFTIIMLFIWLERRLIGRFQVRLGPNRAGPWGILQPVADAIKVLTKEDIVPERGDRWVHLLAPIVAFIPTLMFFAVIPIQPGDKGIFVNLNIGILYIIAIGTLSIIAIFMAGWASNNKYSLLGAMRAVAQLISYEIPMVLSIVGVVMVAGSLQMSRIVEAQSIPFILLQPLSFLIYFIGATAELNRSPMDLLEAESELVAGYQTEYSGMKFALFYLAEYGNALAVSAIVTTLFLAGWKPDAAFLPSWLWFAIKVFAVFCILIWIRSTLPRLRVDQLMGFAWKFLLPLALINIVITGIELLACPTFPWWLMFVNIAIAGLLIYLWSLLFKRGYGLGLLKGLAITLRNASRIPITTQYPEERLNISRRWRGQEFVWQPEKCIGCTSCVQACPHGVIRISISGKRKGPVVEKFKVDYRFLLPFSFLAKERVIEEVKIDLGRCIYCGLCVEACPIQALSMGSGYESARYHFAELVVGKEELAAPGKVPSAYARPELEKQLPEQTLLVYQKEHPWESQ